MDTTELKALADAKWSAELQARLIEVVKDQEPDVRDLMAEAACLLKSQSQLTLIASHAAQAERIGELEAALKYYADGEHFMLSDESAWDTVSGEPSNFQCDEAGTATVEDGTLAKLVLAGQKVNFDSDEPVAAAPRPVSAPAEPEHMNTQSSREYLVKFMEQHFTDKTYHRYIRGERGAVSLAGDFAWQMARALRMLSQPAPVSTDLHAASDPITYTVDGVVMSPLEYISYLHGELSATLAASSVAPQENVALLAGLQVLCIAADQEWCRQEGALSDWDKGWFNGQLHIFDNYTSVEKEAIATAREYIGKLSAASSVAPKADSVGGMTALDYRAQGREEALAVILAEDPENPFGECTNTSANGDCGDYSTHWDADALRELFAIGDRKHDAYDRAEAAYWEAMGRTDAAKWEMTMVERAPFYKPLHDFLSKHKAWDLMASLKRPDDATPAAVAPKVAAPDCLSDTKRLDFIENGTVDLRCYDAPTAGGDDADVYWNVIEHHMAEPHEREIGWGNNAREAIDAARRAPVAPVAPSDAVADQNEFERQAKYQGASDFTLALGMRCANGWFPATYACPETELAWRVWANKATPPSQAPAPVQGLTDDVICDAARSMLNKSGMERYINGDELRFLPCDLRTFARAIESRITGQSQKGLGGGE